VIEGSTRGLKKSPGEQKRALKAYAEREGFELVAVHEELDVSADTPLEKRRGLRSAVERGRSSGG
jgi:hypothetical protein